MTVFYREIRCSVKDTLDLAPPCILSQKESGRHGELALTQICGGLIAGIATEEAVA